MAENKADKCRLESPKWMNRVKSLALANSLTVMRILHQGWPLNQCRRLSVSLAAILVGYLPAAGQAGEEYRMTVRHYAAADKFPARIADLAFDDKGLLWVCPENDNVRLFDGTHVRILDAPVARGVSRREFSRILKDDSGDFFFLSQPQQFVYRLTDAGDLVEDTAAAAINKSTPYNNGYHYFDWDRFIQRGTQEEQKSRLRLRSRLTGNRSFAAYDDSTFAFKEGDSLFAYSHGLVHFIPGSELPVSNVLVLENLTIALRPGGFSLLDGAQGNPEPIALSGDICKDSLYTRFGFRQPMVVLPSTHPHIIYDSRLYRLQLIAPHLVETVLVMDLRSFHHGITKVEFNPHLGLTAVSTRDDGFFLLRLNPFYKGRLDSGFVAEKKQQVFFPLTVRATDTFFTSWCEFTGKGYYRPLDLKREGSRFLFADHSGYVWEGIRNTINCFGPGGSKKVELTIPSPNMNAIDLCEDSRGQFYCLTERSILRYEKGTFQDKRPAMQAPTGGVKFQQLAYVGGGQFWIASNKGLYQYDTSANEIRRLSPIPDVFTLNITKLQGGAILFTCYNEPYYYIYQQGQFYKVPVDLDLMLNETSSVLEDRHKRVWFATTNGFYVTSEDEIEAYCRGKSKDIYYYRYGKNEGLEDLEFNGGLNPSNSRSGDGYLAFNSMDGVIVFHEDSVREWLPADHIGIWTIGKSGEERTAGDTIMMPHDNDGIVAQVRVAYYGSRENLRLEYTSDFMSGTWKEVDEQGRVALNRLAPGSYHLVFRTRAGLGPGDYLLRTLTVQVSYLFYETPAFRIFAGIFLLTIITLVAVSIVRLRKQVRLKNMRLYEQNIELQQALADLEDNISLKEKLISLILHDLKTPLYFQSLLLNKINEADYFTNEEGRRVFHELRQSSTAILQLTKEFLTWYSVQREGFVQRPAKFDYMVIVNDLFSVYRDIAAKKNVELIYRTAGVQDLYTDRTILEIILRNLLDNAVKYTEAGNVTLLFEWRPEGDAIIVSDTGRGMTAGKINELREYANKTRALSSPTFGYRFIYTMAEKIGAILTISSEPGKGTIVTIIVPR